METEDEITAVPAAAATADACMDGIRKRVSEPLRCSALTMASTSSGCVEDDAGDIGDVGDTGCRCAKCKGGNECGAQETEDDDDEEEVEEDNAGEDTDAEKTAVEAGAPPTDEVYNFRKAWHA